MNKYQAKYLWVQLCMETVGGNDSEVFKRVLPFGVMATSHGLPCVICGKNEKEEATAVADFLQNWADKIRENAK